MPAALLLPVETVLGAVCRSLAAAAALYRAAGFVEFQWLPSVAPWRVPVTEVGYHQLELG